MRDSVRSSYCYRSQVLISNFYCDANGVLKCFHSQVFTDTSCLVFFFVILTATQMEE